MKHNIIKLFLKDDGTLKFMLNNPVNNNLQLSIKLDSFYFSIKDKIKWTMLTP